MYRTDITDIYEGMLAETIVINGAQGDLIHAYFARPLGPGPYLGVVLTAVGIFYHYRKNTPTPSTPSTPSTTS